MQKEIIIGAKPLQLMSNGATPIRYKMAFKSDLMVELNQMNNGKKDEGELVDIVSRLAYVMAAQADGDKIKLNSLCYDKYIEWLESFETMDFIKAAEAIISIYMGQVEGTSKPKKKEGQQKEK